MTGMDEAAIESLLSDALRPVDPPPGLFDRLQAAMSGLGGAAADELSDWADEVGRSEMVALRDPRNWVRPVVAVAAGSVATGTLLLLEIRRRSRRRPGLQGMLDELRSKTGL